MRYSAAPWDRIGGWAAWVSTHDKSLLIVPTEKGKCLGQPVAVLLDEWQEIKKIANRHGYRFFTNEESFRQYVSRNILVDDAAAA